MIDLKKFALAGLAAAVMGGTLAATAAPAEAHWRGYGYGYRHAHYGYFNRPYYRRVVFVGAPYYHRPFYRRHFARWGYGHRYHRLGWNGWGRRYW